MTAKEKSNWSHGTWFITGTSSGFGRELARAVLARGGRVIATARNPAVLQELRELGGDRVLTLALDVTDPAQVAAALAASQSHFSGIDVLVNNAGFGMIGSVEETSEADYRHLFEVNYFGLVAMTRALLPLLRAQRRGWIVNISSVAGLIGHAGSGCYSASKFAVEGFSESLRHELAPLGIGVLTVEPGFFRTEFGHAAQHQNNGIADYQSSVGRTSALMAQMRGHEPGDPQRAANAIIDALDGGQTPAQLPLGAGAAESIDRKLAAQRESMAKWRQQAADADFPA